LLCAEQFLSPMLIQGVKEKLKTKRREATIKKLKNVR
jgi:hypothetical protein